MMDWKHLGYIVALVGERGNILGLASGIVQGFREAHAEKRTMIAARPKARGEWRVVITRGFVR